MKAIDQGKLALRIIEDQPRHDIIYSAAEGKDRKIYLGLSSEFRTAGDYGLLAAYDPAADRFEVAADLLDVIPHGPADDARHPHSKIHTTVCVADDGRVMLATHMTAPPKGEDSYHYWQLYNDPHRCFLGSHLVIYDPKTRKAEDFGVVAPKGGCRWLTYNPVREELYLTSFLTAHFIVIRLRTGEVKDLGRIAQHDFMGPCWSAADGHVYTTDSRGFLLKYHTDTERIETLPLQIPRDPWFSTDGLGIWQFVSGPDRKKLYGAAYPSTRIFEFDPVAGKHGVIRDFGPTGAPGRIDAYSPGMMHPRSMAIGPDNTLYICTSNFVSKEPGSHVVTIDIDSGEKTDHGMIQIDGMAPAEAPVACCVASDGTFYMAGQEPNLTGLLTVYMFNRKGMKKKTPAGYLERYGKQPLAARAFVDVSDYGAPRRDVNAIFVSKGTMIAQEQGMSGRIPVIPRNESAISALHETGEGFLFGTTAGERNHFFLFMPQTKKFHPLTTFGQAGDRCRCMVEAGNGRLYFATSAAAGPGHLYSFDLGPQRSFLSALDSADRGEFKSHVAILPDFIRTIADHGEIVPGEGILTMVAGGNLLYGLSTPGGKFFIHDTVSGKTETRDIFATHIVKKSNISRAMLIENGRIYFSGRHGRVLVYEIAGGSFRETAMKIPCGAGREYLNSITGLVSDGRGHAFGGTAADGMLFRMDLGAETLTVLGKPTAENCIRSLTLNHDGVLWGLAGMDADVTHLFSYDTATGAAADMGMLRAKIPFTWVVHRADVIKAGLDGQLFIGESDAVSHLHLYFPPVQSRTAAVAG